MRSVIGALLLILAAAPVGGPLEAQGRSGRIRGVILEGQRRTPIEGARISLVGTERAATTDSRGEFEFDELEPGKYVIQAAAIGYSILNSPLILRERETLDIEFEAESEGVRLPDLTVEERANHGPMDWLRRKSEGRGRYITRADLEERRSATVPDALRMLAGVRIECRTSTVCVVRMARSPRNCGPGYFMDGIPTDPAVVWLTPVQEIEGIEVYSGPAETPPELEGYQSRCGAIVLWTRTPPPRRPKQKKPKKSKPGEVAPADSLRTDSLPADAARARSDTTQAGPRLVLRW
jgi:hypothetical protein